MITLVLILASFQLNTQVDLYIKKPLLPETQITVEEPIRQTFTSDVEKWRDLVTVYFPSGVVDEALQIVFCESRGDPNATNPSGTTGLFQIMPFSDRGTQEELKNPEFNVKIAVRIYNDSKWNQWSCKP